MNFFYPSYTKFCHNMHWIFSKFTPDLANKFLSISYNLNSIAIKTPCKPPWPQWHASFGDFQQQGRRLIRMNASSLMNDNGDIKWFFLLFFCIKRYDISYSLISYKEKRKISTSEQIFSVLTFKGMGLFSCNGDVILYR